MRVTAGGFPVREGRAQSHCPKVPFQGWQGRGAGAEQDKSSLSWSHEKWCKEPGSFWGPQQASAVRGAAAPTGSLRAADASSEAATWLQAQPVGYQSGGQRWAARAARATARPSTDQGHREGVTESRAARCIPSLPSHARCPGHQSSSSSRQSYLLPLTRESPAVGTRPCAQAERPPAGHTHHVGGQLVPWQVLHVFVLRVDDVSEPPASHLLLQHPHVHLVLEGAQPCCIGASDLGDDRAPAWAEQSCGQRALKPLAPVSPVHNRSPGVLVKGEQLAPGTVGHRWEDGDRAVARRGDPGVRAAGAHQLPEPTTQTFLPPMVRGDRALRSVDPTGGISSPPGAGAAPARLRLRLAPGGNRAPVAEAGPLPQAQPVLGARWAAMGGCTAGADWSPEAKVK